jgi:hypothetical protein
MAASGQGLFRPAEAAVDPAVAVAQARSATVDQWSTSDAQLTLDATEPGWVFVDRAWWPAWRTEIDGKPVPTYRAFGAQLVSVPAGRHVLTQRLVPWEALAGLALGVLALSLAIGYTVVERRPAMASRWPRRRGSPIAP